ncbi:MAG TPA: glycosyltransferase family 4 protein [Myxococcota bacterium]|nr:glycosyltransferase family 4 protein [Myxococcota bacterium]
MRIALTHPRASDVGGVERQAHSVAQALLDAGHEVHFFCQRADGSIDPRIAVHRISNPLRPVRWFKVWWFDRACERAVAAAGPFDLVHGFGKTSRQDVYFDGSGCLADFQIWSIDAAIGSPWRRRLRRASLHQRVVARIECARYTRGNYRRVLAISELVRRQILDRYRLPPEDVERLYPGVDLDRFAPDPAARAHARRALGVGDGVPLLAFLGSDYRRKGIDTLLAAVARLPGAHAFVIGAERAGPRTRFEADARAAGIAGRVHWLGVRPDPQRWLAAADLMLFPTRFDAFGSAVLEALACGVPAVVSRRAGAAELVSEGKTGSALDALDDGAAWAAAARPFLDRARRDELRALARESAEHHPWSRHAERVLEVYRELTSAGPPKGQ